ncbi:MAG: ribbon-helix-helix protein, CopG family [Deltaproteobacteria bacterium]|nr:ribbon-helix-helix protein, CopG family [Deltaproteobacteria bacterium]
MKARTLTIRIDAKLDRQLDRAASDTGRSRGDLVRNALTRQLSVLRFEKVRGKILPFAESAGLLTDEDVFRLIS